jgi:hypothetical protein
MNEITIMELVQQDESQRPQTEPCVFCVDYTKGSLSDRACDECNPPLYEKFLSKENADIHPFFADFIMFSERIRIAKRVDEVMEKHNIKKDTFGVVCALAIIGALKKPDKIVEKENK